MAWSKTGTYDPLAAAVFPDAGKVLEDVTEFGPTGAEYAGTYHPCAVAEVLDTVSFGAASAETGTYHAPDAGEVISTAVFGAASGTAGTFVVPAEADVKDGVNYGVETV
jgi:roadblock/LC7 domain-containing protein